MFKNTTDSAARQPKPTRAQVLLREQNQWREDTSAAMKKKDEIGYNNLRVDDFLKIVPSEMLNSAAQTSILELQDTFTELNEREQLLWAEDRIVEEFNKIHAVVHIDETYILTEKTNHFGCKDFSFESLPSFKAYYVDERIVCIDGVERSKADIWWKSPKRRKYDGIVFDPRGQSSNKKYNLWRGFARAPQQGDCSRYWAHVKEVICAGNEEAYLYVRKWLAIVFQQPDVIHTALVLCASQGTGKNSFVDPLGELLGAHYAPLSGMHELVSNFNFHLKNAVLIHANEALWGGHKKDIGTVKAMITEHFGVIESKGKDRIVVGNFKHIILSSNEEWPVHLDPDDRRFFVLRVSEKRKEDHVYFEQLKNELKNSGLEALLYDLLNEDLTGFNPRRFPSSQNSFEIKMRSTDSRYRYICAALQDGGFSISKGEGNPVWQTEIPKDSVYEDYTAWCIASGEIALQKTLLGKALSQTFQSMTEIRPLKNNRTRCYKFPDDINIVREEFAKKFKELAESIFDTYEDNYGIMVERSKVVYGKSII